MPSRSFTACRNRCLHPRYFSVVCTDSVFLPLFFFSWTPPPGGRWEWHNLSSYAIPGHSPEQGSMKPSPEALALCRKTLRCFICIDGRKVGTGRSRIIPDDSVGQHPTTRLEKPSVERARCISPTGYISDPTRKNKTVWLTEKEAKLSEELFEKSFATQ